MTYRNPNYQKEYRLKNKVKAAAYSKEYRLKNREALLESKREYRREHREEIGRKSKIYYLKNKEAFSFKSKEFYQKNKERIYRKTREYIQKNREKTRIDSREYKRERNKIDIQFRLAGTIRSRLGGAVRNGSKRGSAVRDLGCTIPELKMYLEGQFKDGMNWGNWGCFGWHIDHKIPLTFFDLSNREQVLQAVHYSNLQPMWWNENLSKGARISDSPRVEFAACAGRKDNK